MENNNKEFLEFIDEEVSKQNISDKATKDFLLKVPHHYHNFVLNRIDIKHNGNLEQYLNTKEVKLFLAKFTREDKAYAEASIIVNKNNYRKVSKRKKQSILWAGQLLGAVGGSLSSTAPYPVINMYLKEIEEQTEFCRKTKLLNSAGKKAKLTDPKQRKKERYAESFKRLYAMDDKAKDLGYECVMLTFTLPPSFHPNPSKGKYSYSGATPQQALDTINHFWELFRSNLAEQGLKVGEDFFGYWSNEGHKDSCIHKHCAFYLDPKKLSIYQKVFNTLMLNERKRLALLSGIDVKNPKHFKKFKMNWDFKQLNSKKAKVTTYLFKYLSPDMNDKETIANDALFFAYGSRRLQFFGENSKISVFRHIIRNWKPYEKYIDDKEVIKMLKSKDLYLFNSKYQDDFENVSIKVDGKRKYLGVSYVPNRNSNDGFNKKELLIEKKQYTIFDCQDKAIVKGFNESMLGLKLQDDIDLYNNNLANLLGTFPKAQKKQFDFNELVLNYYGSQYLKGFDNIVPVAKCLYSQTNDNVIKQYNLEVLEEQKIKFELNAEDDYFKEYNGIKKESEIELDINTEFLLLTLKHNYSSKNPSGFCKTEENITIPINEEEFLEVLR